MKKVYIGIDAHKASNTLALAFEENRPAELYGKVSADLDRFLKALRAIQKKYHVPKEGVRLCYEAGPQQGTGGMDLLQSTNELPAEFCKMRVELP